MKFLRRLIAWSCFVGLLAAVGVVVFHWVRYTPRLVVAGDYDVLCLSEDRQRLLTSKTDVQMLPDDDFVGSTRLHVVDARNGRDMWSFDVPFALRPWPWGLMTVATVGRREQRRYIAFCRSNSAVIIDWQRGEQWMISVGEDLYEECKVSDTGRWLPVKAGTNDKGQFCTIVIDIPDRRIARRLSGDVLGFIRNDQLAVCRIDKHRIDIVDMSSGAVTTSIEPEMDLTEHCLAMLLSPDGRWIVLGRLGIWREISTLYGVEVWDLFDRRIVFRSPPSDSSLPDTFGLVFPEPGGSCATWLKSGSDFHITALKPAKNPPETSVTIPGNLVHHKHSSNPLANSARVCARFSPNGAVFLVDTITERGSKVVVFDTSSGRLLWEKANFGFGRFLGEGELVMGSSRFGKDQPVLDSVTGAVRAVLATDMPMFCHPPMTPGHPFIIMVGYADRPARFWDRWLQKFRPLWYTDSRGVLTVTEPSSGSELLRLHGVPGNALLSDDGRTLVTWVGLQFPPAGDQAKCSFQVWDVHPRRAYFWATTWSLGVGVILLWLRHWRMKRKKTGSRSERVPTANPG